MIRVPSKPPGLNIAYRIVKVGQDGELGDQKIKVESLRPNHRVPLSGHLPGTDIFIINCDIVGLGKVNAANSFSDEMIYV